MHTFYSGSYIYILPNNDLDMATLLVKSAVNIFLLEARLCVSWPVLFPFAECQTQRNTDSRRESCMHK
jgi:hypothetical protein